MYEFRGLYVAFISLFRFLMGGVSVEPFLPAVALWYWCWHWWTGTGTDTGAGTGGLVLGLVD